MSWGNHFAVSFPGSAWERTTRQAQPAVGWPNFLDVQRGRASRVVRSQAEPGNEENEESKKPLFRDCLRAAGLLQRGRQLHDAARDDLFARLQRSDLVISLL